MTNEPKPRLDLEAVRAKLADQSGPAYWRSLEEVAETPEFQAWVDDEFPNRRSLLEFDRRSLLKFMGASMALAGLSGCRGVFLDQDKVVPYVKQPEDLVPGKPLFYASALTLGGFASGVLVEQHEGRPTKIEGNPDHPESRGATFAWMQASVLNLYDPDRMKNAYDRGQISTWTIFLAKARELMAQHKANGGAGVRILTETSTSPTWARQVAQLQKAYPNAQWHAYEPGHRDNAHEGAMRAFGMAVETTYDFTQADVIVSLDADPFTEGPGALRYARDFANGRRVEGNPTGETKMNRLYVVESVPSLAGTMADHRWRARASEVASVAGALASALGLAAQGQTQVPVAAIAKDLQANRGRSIVVCGAHQPPEVHALVHQINAALGNVGTTVKYLPWLEVSPGNHLESLRALTTALNDGRVETLLIFGGNPVYTAPSDLSFLAALSKAKVKVYHGTHRNETSRACDWELPATHELEHWSDARTYDGTVSITQPLTAPLFEGRSVHEALAAILNQPTSGFDLVRETHRAMADPAWRKALHTGVVPNSAPAGATVAAQATAFAPRAMEGTGPEIRFQLDSNVYDGRFANNGWLMELPHPITKVTWENVVLMSPSMAESLKVGNEDIVRLRVGGATVASVPVWVQPGMPDNQVAVSLGYGQEGTGTIAKGAGFNAYALRTSAAPWVAGGVTVEKLAGQHPVSSTQTHNQIKDSREVIRFGTLERFREDVANEREVLRPDGAYAMTDVEDKSLYPGSIFEHDGPQWGMTIDMNTCIGCNACVVACQAENNIPVVGKEQVKRGRELHWLRIDRYYVGNLDEPSDTVWQPMMCVHCEKAPCEPVCPVAATVHSHEGLNQMVYNRCVGTRYCSNNCPYKVRRFNYFNYSDNSPQFANRVAKEIFNNKIVPGPLNEPKQDGITLLRMLNNPDVTVRGRGVMEKCTYCVQRINDARIEAKKQGRDPIEGEVVTACQQACPTQTIVFGNIADPGSRVSKLRQDPRSYLVLEDQQTRPRTSYLGKLRNPNPEIQS